MFARFEYYKDMIVVPCICPICRAQYLGWVDQRQMTERNSHPVPRYADYPSLVFDLSYLSTFNDEPGEDDLPEYEVQVIITYHRVGRYQKGEE